MPTKLSTPSLYEQDYKKWLEETVRLLRHRSFNLIDIDHLIDEVESMGKSQKDALESNLVILLMHLLKYQYQPEKRQHSNSWRYTIVER